MRLFLVHNVGKSRTKVAEPLRNKSHCKATLCCSFFAAFGTFSGKYSNICRSQSPGVAHLLLYS